MATTVMVDVHEQRTLLENLLFTGGLGSDRLILTREDSPVHGEVRYAGRQSRAG